MLTKLCKFERFPGRYWVSKLVLEWLSKDYQITTRQLVQKRILGYVIVYSTFGLIAGLLPSQKSMAKSY